MPFHNCKSDTELRCESRTKVIPVDLQTLGFASNYSCEIAPEFPGSGDWGCPVYRFVERPELVERFAQLGEPFVIRIRHDDGSEWVGLLARGFYGLRGVYSCPNPDQICVVIDGSGYLIDTRSPSDYRSLPMHPILSLERVHDTGTVLCGGFIDLLLIDGDGLLWVSGRLCLDDLHVRNIDRSTINCTGRQIREDETWFSVSLKTGQLVSGTPFQEGKDDR